MEKDSKITINKNTKIIVPGTSYDFKSDHRLLIPFTQEDKIGFINQGGDVVVVKSEQAHPLGDGKNPFTGGQK